MPPMTPPPPPHEAHIHAINTHVICAARRRSSTAWEKKIKTRPLCKTVVSEAETGKNKVIKRRQKQAAVMKPGCNDTERGPAEATRRRRRDRSSSRLHHLRRFYCDCSDKKKRGSCARLHCVTLTEGLTTEGCRTAQIVKLGEILWYRGRLVWDIWRHISRQHTTVNVLTGELDELHSLNVFFPCWCS